MPKGYSDGVPLGRKVGSVTQKNSQWEALAKSIVNEHSTRFNTILVDCDDKTFLDSYLRVLNYFKPKLSNIETNLEGSKNEITINVKKWV